MSAPILNLQVIPEEATTILEALTVYRALRGETDEAMSVWWKCVGALGELKVELQELEGVEEAAVVVRAVRA